MRRAWTGFTRDVLKMWQDPEHRALMAEKMAARKARGEVLFKRKPAA